MSLIVKSIDSPDGDLAEKINSILRTHNCASNPRFWALADEQNFAAKPLNLFAFIDGEAVGGLFASTQLSWLKLTILAVDEVHRKNGIGSRLVFDAEREAMSRSCRYSYVDTMDFQAPRLYLNLGYTLCGRLADWDSHGHDKLFFSKRLR